MAEGEVRGAALLTGVAAPGVVFATMTAVVLRMRQGRNWARVVLAAALGVLGSASLLVGPVVWLADGHSVGDLVDAVDAMAVLFVASRVIHVGAVWLAPWLMFRPAARPWFGATRRTSRARSSRTWVPHR